MSKSKHTPGPWKWARQVRKKGSWLEEKRPPRIWSIHTEEGEGIAYIGPLVILSKHAIAKTEANAQLMAAAPELLEALEMAFDGYNAIPGCDYDWGAWGKKVRSIIAKAKGKHENQTS